MDNKTVNIDWLIAKIDYELSQSTLSRYTTTTGKQIVTDVGYVEDWWNEYKKDLINCLNQTGSVKKRTRSLNAIMQYVNILQILVQSVSTPVIVIFIF